MKKFILFACLIMFCFGCDVSKGRNKVIKVGDKYVVSIRQTPDADEEKLSINAMPITALMTKEYDDNSLLANYKIVQNRFMRKEIYYFQQIDSRGIIVKKDNQIWNVTETVPKLINESEEEMVVSLPSVYSKMGILYIKDIKIELEIIDSKTIKAKVLE